MNFVNTTFLRFGITSFLNTLIGFGAIFFMQEIIHINPYLSNVIGYCIGYLISYSLNRTWTFEFSGGYLKSVGLFILVSSVAFVCNIIVLYTLLYFHISALISQICSIMAHGIMHYIGMKHVAFKQQIRT